MACTNYIFIDVNAYMDVCSFVHSHSCTCGYRRVSVTCTDVTARSRTHTDESECVMPKIDPRDLHDCLADDRSDATTHNPHTRTHARTHARKHIHTHCTRAPATNMRDIKKGASRCQRREPRSGLPLPRLAHWAPQRISIQRR